MMLLLVSTALAGCADSGSDDEPMDHDSRRPGTCTMSRQPGDQDGSVQVQESFTPYGR